MYKIILLLMLLTGCAINEEMKFQTFHYIDSQNYNSEDVLIIVKTITFKGLDNKSYAYSDVTYPPEDTYIVDQYLDKDVEDIKECLNNYNIFQVSSNDELIKTLTQISHKPKINRLLICFIGEGESKAFIPFRYLFNNSTCLSGTKIKYKEVLELISLLNTNETCVLIGCCQAGSALAVIPKEFKGTIITNAPDGFATTPCESSGNTSFYSTIIPLLREHQNLSSCTLKNAGQPFNNFRHKFADFWTGTGLKISYDIERFTNSPFIP